MKNNRWDPKMTVRTQNIVFIFPFYYNISRWREAEWL